MVEQVDITFEPEDGASSPDSQLSTFSWYLGSKTTTEAALLVLQNSAITNCFAVYRKPMEENFTISIKITPDSTKVEVFEHLQISRNISGQYIIPGQELSSNELLELIDKYIHSFLPPLLPAVGTNAADLPSDGHLFQSTNKSLSNQISGSSITSSTEERKLLSQSYINSPTLRSGTKQSQWQHFQKKHCYHPKNICFGCCYRRKDWNGTEYLPEYSWYDLRGNGPLRFLGLLLFWLSCGLCFGTYHGLKYAMVYILHVCCQFYDNES